MKKYLNEAAGWTGALLTLTAFCLNSQNIISGQSIEYLFLNIAGSFCLVIYAFIKKAPASWVLNSIWMLITAAALIKFYVVQ